MLPRTMATLAAAAAVLAACAQTSPIMDTGDGAYFISARAAPARGGATGAQTVAYGEAQKFCAQQDGKRPILLGSQERDVYQSAYGGAVVGQPGSFGGGFSGGTSAAGSVNMRFRCQ